MTWVAVGVGGTTALIGGIKTISGNRKMKKLEKNRPQYEIPQEYMQNVQNAQQGLTEAQHAAMQGMGEAQKQQYIQNVNRNSAFALSQADDRKSGLAGVSDIAQSNVDAFGKLAAMDSEARSANQDKVFGARQFLAQQQGAMGEQKGMQWQTNVMNPYAQKVANAQGLIGAGMNDMSTGLQSMAGAALGGAMNGGFKKKNKNALTEKNKEWLNAQTAQDNAETQKVAAPWG